MMIQFTVSLADFPIQIKANHPESKRFCQDYLCDDIPAFDLSITAEDIAFEREQSKIAAEIENRQTFNYSDPYLETLAIYRKIADALSQHHTFLIHGAAIAIDDEVYLFTAKSGTGKTTHIRNWRKIFGDRALIVNGDKPLIKVRDDGVFVCGTPWCGKEHYGSNCILPLKAVCLLERAFDNQIEKIAPENYLAGIFEQIYRPTDDLAFLAILDDLNKVLTDIPFYRLGCNMDQASAIVAYEGMR